MNLDAMVYQGKGALERSTKKRRPPAKIASRLRPHLVRWRKIDEMRSGELREAGILENGDPLENNSNFGGFPYKGTNGFTYNLQDLVTLPYFGAPPSTSVHGEFTFHGEALTVCENGS